ncbi:MAG TPA: S9 family peptidase, partial [Planctomycetota bacterium]|nr:S9 family peptidase [Planctomycetota bacterium]
TEKNRLKPRSDALACALIALCATLLLADGVPTHAEGSSSRAFTLEDLLSLERVSDVQVSPLGTDIAYVLRVPSLEKNSFTSHIWLVPAAGGAPRQLTNHEKGESRPRWSPDGKVITFLSGRDGTNQIWRIPVGGGEASRVTSLSTGADGHVGSPDGKLIAFTSDVWPDLSGDAAQKKRAEEIAASGIQARVIDTLLYRHWNGWRNGKRTHVFVVPAEGGEARDVTPGDFDAPPFSLGGPDAFAISPDGREIAYTRGPAGPSEAWSTNADIFIVSTQGGEAMCLTAGNKGWDGSPVWSPDGTRIAFRSQAREGYEADRFRLAVASRKTGETRYLAAGLDRSVDEILWSPDGGRILIGVEDEGRSAIHEVRLEGLVEKGAAREVFKGAIFSGLSMPRDGSFIAGGHQSLTSPTQAAVLTPGDRTAGRDSLRLVTRANEALFSARDMPSIESVRYPGARGKHIQAWVLKPPGHAAGKRAPFILFIHGGPQGAWLDAFSFRWTPALYAARGYVVMLPNPHGSTGFGQEFTEQVSGDWSGACYEDIMKAADWAIAEGLADPERMAAMGGSFGGYMVNWILGHTNRFKALVSHAGVYNLESMYGSTEELWFPEWDLRGTPWKSDGSYEKHSPHRHAARFRTPTLVIHGELDYRVPVTEGMQLFTALRRQGVESRFLHYPDEGHWVLKLKNSKLWNETVLAWLDKFIGRP